ncbi:hypothetical protein ASC77_23565 [Nocardioides sp. Root1257]|uniref:hypothetical protein n=1 Tax=unclassified Nocardioides TaxID=2615069 RepID=UPI0006FDEAC3|nr:MULTISPECIES: hypothetical protein [unclassified Nocardioides]KQW42642.1 hypothetical protein ASC77_23565 [Nocardioides sp. Root1257]KRC39900.1 hypothetical protein ASE24_23360 [Nocardioides sp. Root224]
MLTLLAIPVLWAVMRTHEYLQAYAPTNVLARSARCAPPTWDKAVGLPTLTLAFLAATRGLAEAVAAGAPSWLNLAVLVLAWDTMKVGCVTVGVEACAAARICRRATQP